MVPQLSTDAKASNDQLAMLQKKRQQQQAQLVRVQKNYQVFLMNQNKKLTKWQQQADALSAKMTKSFNHGKMKINMQLLSQQENEANIQGNWTSIDWSQDLLAGSSKIQEQLKTASDQQITQLAKTQFQTLVQKLFTSAGSGTAVFEKLVSAASRVAKLGQGMGLTENKQVTPATCKNAKSSMMIFLNYNLF